VTAQQNDRPDVAALTPLETQHISLECRTSKGHDSAWEEAVHLLGNVYDAQVGRRPGATVSVAIYVTDPRSPEEA
jgi:hypothetical protein